MNCRGKTPIFVYLTWQLRQSVLRLAVRGIVFPVGLFGVIECRCLRASTMPSTASRWDKRWVNSRGKTPIFVYLAWRLWQSVLRLAVRGNSISGRVVRRQRVPVV
jgi:hypothetical protein